MAARSNADSYAGLGRDLTAEAKAQAAADAAAAAAKAARAVPVWSRLVAGLNAIATRLVSSHADAAAKKRQAILEAGRTVAEAVLAAQKAEGPESTDAPPISSITFDHHYDAEGRITSTTATLHRK